MKKLNIFAYIVCLSLAFGGVHLAFADDDSQPAAMDAAAAAEPTADMPDSAPSASDGGGEKAAGELDGGSKDKAIAAAGEEGGEGSEDADMPSGVMSLVSMAFKATTEGNWLLAVSVFLLILIGAAKLARDKLKWGMLAFLDKKWGKWTALFVSSFAGVMVAALTAGASPSLALAMKALMAALSGAGLHTLKQDVVG